MDDDTITLLVILPVIGSILLALAVGSVLVVRNTVQKRGNWGINTKPVRCPGCGEPAPVVRAPKNLPSTLGRLHVCQMRS